MDRPVPDDTVIPTKRKEEVGHGWMDKRNIAPTPVLRSVSEWRSEKEVEKAYDDYKKHEKQNQYNLEIALLIGLIIMIIVLKLMGIF